MRVLIIGGTGLISTAIVEQLLARGHEVTILTRGKTRSRLPSTVAHVLCDRHDTEMLCDIARDLPVDAVIDMVAFRLEDSHHAFTAFNGRVKRFIHCSTVCVYGGPLSRLPAREDEPHTPVSDYGLNKSACEAFLIARFQDDGFPVTIIRPSMTYGEGGAIMHSLGGDTYLLHRLRHGLPVVVHGDGQGLWACAHVSDVSRAFAKALETEAAIGQAYHVTGDEWMTWNQYYATLADAVGGRYHPVHIPTTDLYALAPDQAGISSDIFQWPGIFDNSKAKRDLGYEYRIPWADGARRTVRWIEEHWGITPEGGEVMDRLIAAWDSARTAAQSAFTHATPVLPGM